MDSLLSPYVLIMLAAALICGFIVINVWPRRRDNSETLPIILLLLGAIEWIVAALSGLLDQNLAHKLLWAKIEYIGVVFVPLAVLGYVLNHLGTRQQLTLSRLAALSVIPLVTLALAWTNGAHGLIWARYIPYRAGGLILSDKTYGPGFWVYWGYSYLLLLVATILTIRPMLRSTRLFRWQSLLVLTGILAPWIGNLLYVLHLNPFGDLDLTPLAFGISGILLAVGMFGWRLFDIKPVAQAAVIAGMPDGLIILDTRGRIVDVNQAAQRILGLAMRELVGKPMEQVIQAWQPRGEGSDAPDSQRFELKLKIGPEERVYELSDSPFYEKLAAPGGRIIFLHDITRRKRLEEMLQESVQKQSEALLQQSENKYTTLYQNMPVGVIYRGPEGILIDMNPAAETILGVRLVQIRDLAAFHTTLKPVRADGSDFPVEEYPGKFSLNTGQPLLNQVMGICFQNEPGYHWINISTVPQFKPGEQQPYQVFITFEDITQARLSEQALQENEKRFRALVEHSMEEISLVDPHGTLTWESPTARRPLGYPPDSFVGRNLDELIHPDDLPAANQLFEKIHAHPGDVQEGLFRVRHQDGSWRWMEAVLTNLLDEPAVQSVVINYRDVTERKHAEDELHFRNAILTATQEASGDGLLVVDENARIVSYNQRFIEIMGIPQELVDQKVDAPVLELVASRVVDPQAFLERVRFLYENAGEIAQDEILLKNGRILDRYSTPMIGMDNVYYGRVWYFRDITERKQRDEEIHSRNAELTSLYQLSRLLADADDLATVIDLVNQYTVESVHTTFAGLALLEDGDLAPRAVYPVRSLSPDFGIAGRQPLGALPLCQKVLETNEPLILLADNPGIGDTERDILLLDFARSVCLVPLKVGDASQGLSVEVGLLILGEARDGNREPFTSEKLRLARNIGDQAATAIRRMRLHEQAERRSRQLASLSEIDRTIASILDVRISLQMILRHVCEQLAVDAAGVLVFNEPLQSLEFTAGRGLLSPGMLGTRHRLGEGQAGKAALERQMVQIPDVAASRAVFSRSNFIKAEQVAAYFAIPLITKGKLKGVLEVYQRSSLYPNEEWLDFFNTLAGQAAIAIDNVQMFEHLQRSTDELELAYDATIEGWSHALDLRDKETEGHTRRVTELTVRLARLFGISEMDLVQVRWGALLHDIGKMGVPDGILLKPGPLTDEEWVVMKKHPGLAYELLTPIRFLRQALDIPYCHHEKWDGSGYPRGLKGDRIPLVARIFAVVDVWDAVTSDRPYRQAWSQEKARQHIREGAGTHFDPHVVEKFFEELG